jgi:hypothetical protein
MVFTVDSDARDRPSDETFASAPVGFWGKEPCRWVPTVGMIFNPQLVGNHPT